MTVNTQGLDGDVSVDPFFKKIFTQRSEAQKPEQKGVCYTWFELNQAKSQMKLMKSETRGGSTGLLTDMLGSGPLEGTVDQRDTSRCDSRDTGTKSV